MENMEKWFHWKLMDGIEFKTYFFFVRSDDHDFNYAVRCFIIINTHARDAFIEHSIKYKSITWLHCNFIQINCALV